MFIGRAEAHHFLDAGAVVPGPVEQHDFTGSGQVLNVSLEIPLSALNVAWLFKSDDPSPSWIEMFHETFDGSSLSRGVAPLEENHHLLFRRFDPSLHFEQFHLQVVLLLLVALP
jgi:hypothetical protein